MKGSIQSILFFIAVLKTVIGTEEVIYAQVGQDVTLNAPADSNTKDYRYWFFYKEKELQLSWMNPMGGKWITTDKSWKEHLSLSGDSMVIKGIDEAKFGTYWYKQGLGQSTIFPYKLHKLSVNVKPDSILLPGEMMSLNCNVDSLGQKQPQIYWQTPWGESKTVHDTRNIIVKSQDSGEWTCVVVNGQKEHKVKISVKVVEFSPAPKLKYTSTTSQLNIPFSIRSYNSWEKIEPLIKKIQWSFTPKRSSNQNPEKLFSFPPENSTEPIGNLKELKHVNHLGNFSLSRDKGRKDDQGVYICSIIFKKGHTLKSSVQVEVLQITPSPELTLTSGQRLKLLCTIGEPLPPDVELKWSHKKNSPYTTENNSLLIIEEVRIEDGGRWKCGLWRNNSCLTSAEIKLNIEPVLSVWMLVTICSAAAIIILLVVLTVILCRRRQRKRRHLRHRLCRCENPKPKGFYRT